MCGWQVKLCDPIVTHGPYLSTLEMLHDKVLHKFMFAVLTVTPYFKFFIKWKTRNQLQDCVRLLAEKTDINTVKNLTNHEKIIVWIGKMASEFNGSFPVDATPELDGLRWQHNVVHTTSY